LNITDNFFRKLPSCAPGFVQILISRLLLPAEIRLSMYPQ